MLERQALTLFTQVLGRRRELLQPACTRILKTRQYCAPAPAPLVADALDAVTRLELRVNRWPHTLGLSYIWLRDHCRCSECYNYNTNQRKLDIQKVPLNIRPASINTSQDGLELQWPDGHKSTYDYKFLWQNSFEGRRTSSKSSLHLWNGATFPKESLITVPLSELEDPSNKGVKRLISSIVTNGLGCISGVEPNVDATRSAVEKLCEVKRTFFGEMWSFQADLERADTAYSDEYLGAHTDTTYFSEAARIQVFHCLKQAPEGGETLLIDGFNIADQYRNRHPEGYAFLTSTAVPSEYIGDGEHQMCLDTTFNHNPATGNLVKFRYNIYDRAPLATIPVEHLQEYYLHMRNLGKIIRNSKNEHWMKLQPGTILLIDNWRVMHGRNKYSGPRVMGGCYLENSSFTSRARALEVQLE